MKIKICPTCVVVASAWLLLSAGIAWNLLLPDKLILLVALLMGGSVVGIADLGVKRCTWAAAHVHLWRALCIGGGMTLAYFFIVNLSKTVVLIEILILLIVAYLFFIKKTGRFIPDNELTNAKKIEEQMEQCC